MPLRSLRVQATVLLAYVLISQAFLPVFRSWSQQSDAGKWKALKPTLALSKRTGHGTTTESPSLQSSGRRRAPLADTSVAASITSEQTFDTDAIIQDHLEELKGLRETPELVDKLEQLAKKYPGIELNLNLYRALYPFELDKFQEDGLSSLMSGNSVLVSTPTGSGKTVVGELAIYFAIMMGLRVAYTTPLKALSNQKYQDFRKRYGGDRVGLLTGDIAINRGASITIMTTEVFRNMVYDPESHSQLSNLFMVCFDEFHYMNDPDRGTVWEESVISCPPSVRILALSATMGNVEEIKGWISSIHGPTDLILSTHRPVPLRYLFAMRQGLLPIFRDPNAGPGAINGVKRSSGKLEAGSTLNPSIIKMEEQVVLAAQQRLPKFGRPIAKPKAPTQQLVPRYSDLVEKLQKMNLLPAIVFIFSRVGCEDSAKQILQAGLHLLTLQESQYVTQAINAFAKINPEIPISKFSVLMLKAGVGVHHAGLIPVWKAFVEDLFNANKIKVLFATETLAAGVNMPARTTVISTVTKRVNSEIIKLKTSQLLQMAGRAGRRGKDDQGTVVVVRNKFEEPRMSHKILTSPVDDIKSHFKASYGFTVKLLESRSLPECKSLIEKGFGAYLLQQRLKKKEIELQQEVEDYRALLQKYTLPVARDYYRVLKRLEKEKKNADYLLNSVLESELELVQAITDYMPLGTGLLLRSGDTGFFLGDIKWGSSNQNNGLGVITRDSRLLVVQKEHIRSFSDGDLAIAPREANDLLSLVSLASEWRQVEVLGCNEAVFEGIYSMYDVNADARIADTLAKVRRSEHIPVPPLPGSIMRQRDIIESLEREMEKNPIARNNDGAGVLQALQYVTTLKDPLGFVNLSAGSNADSAAKTTAEVFAWRMFQSVLKLLQDYDALTEDLGATELGRMIGTLPGDNELWLAMVLRSQHLQNLTEGELGAVMCAVVTDSHKASTSFMKYQASEKVQEAYSELELMGLDLKMAQSDVGIDFPVPLCREVGGLAESWANGITWRELCKDTSLDQGDICRMLRRTVEILRVLPQAAGIDSKLAQIATRAAHRMDRFPVAEMDAQTGEPKDTSGIGFGAGSVFSSSSAAIAEDPTAEDVIEDSLLLNDGDDEEDNEDNLTKLLLENFFDVSGNNQAAESDDEVEKRGTDSLSDENDGLGWRPSKSNMEAILNELEESLEESTVDPAINEAD